MYKLLGADQKEYGPVSADQVRAWIEQGRANARSKLQAAGSTDWKTLAEFPEFAGALQAKTGSAAPPLPGGQPQAATAPPKTSGMAVTSLVLGCLGLLTCGVTALVGLVLGIIALVRINKSEGRLGGQNLALAGTIVSAALLLLVPIFAAMTLPALAKAKAKASGIRCMNNVKQLNLALMMYATDNNDRFPAGTNWCEALGPYLGHSTNALVCPQGTPNQRCHYALNAQLVGRGIKAIQVPAQTVLIFECDGGWNVSGGRELLPAKPRHNGAYVLGFADGHAEMGRSARLEQLRWEP
jgi:prepilin-type processing-associated H-X9-DG protein